MERVVGLPYILIAVEPFRVPGYGSPLTISAVRGIALLTINGEM
jgi:hypothetical protein